MKKHLQSGVSPILIVVIIVALGLIGWAIYQSGQSDPAQTENEAGEAMEDEQMEEGVISVTLGAQNDSGETGTAKLSEVDGKVRVTVELTNAPQDIAQPAHIHAGSCPTPAAVIYPLTNVVNGRSETTIDASLLDLGNRLPLAINVHKSASEVATYVSCGDLPMQAFEALTDDAMVEDGDAMMEDEDATPPAPPSQGGEEKDDAMMESEVKTFNITGQNFAFSPREIRVKQGDKIKINFTSGDGFHDWTLEGYSVGTAQVNTGQSASVEFTADRTGAFEYFCSVGTHRAMGMVGAFIVE